MMKTVRIYKRNPPLRLRLGVLASLALLTTCSEEQKAGSSPVGKLVDGIVETQILVDLDGLEKDATALSAAAKAFCDSPTADKLTAAQNRFRQCAATWYRVQLFNFGPADADPVFPAYTFIDSLRLRGMDYTESARSNLATWSESEETLNDAFFAELRFDDVGLLPLEVALFDAENVLDAYKQAPRRCDVLRGLSNQLQTRAVALQRGWTEDYEDSGTPFAELLLSGKLPNGRYPLVQIIVSAQEYIDYLHKRNVVNVAGQLAEISWDLLAAALDAIEQLLTGKIEGGNIIFWMEELAGPDPAKKVKADLRATREALQDQNVEAFEAALAALDGDFKREVPNALDIELGLTLTDGD